MLQLSRWDQGKVGFAACWSTCCLGTARPCIQKGFCRVSLVVELYKLAAHLPPASVCTPLRGSELAGFCLFFGQEHVRWQRICRELRRCA